MQKLTPKDKKVLAGLEKKLSVKKRKTKRPVVVAMVGLVGSGKTSVAEEIARHMGATLISGETIRVALRKANVSFKNVRLIAEELAQAVLEKGGNLVVDSDFSDVGKRNQLKEAIRRRDIKTYFVRVVCEKDVMIGRIISAKYGAKANDLFAGAKTTWKKSNAKPVIKLREMWRRTPHHYTWSMDDGGQWIQKTITGMFVEIDTTDSKKWKAEAKRAASRMSK